MIDFAAGTGLMKILKLFASEFSRAKPSMQMMWTSISRKTIYLYLLKEISSGLMHYEVCRKPGNAYAHLPLGSFAAHAPHG